GLARIESGPASTFEAGSNELENRGVAPGEIRHVFVTHIHLDHSGGAWIYARHGAKIYVHPKGAEHLVAPERLVSSAARVFGDKMETLWGDINPVPSDNVKVVEDNETVSLGNVKIRAFDTPGHAGHHHSYLVDGALFSGDSAGVRINSGAVIPPTPAPEINIELWQETVKKIREISPDFLCPTHFGEHSDVSEHLDELSENLERFSSWVGERVEAGVPEEEIAPDFQKFLEEHVLARSDDKTMLETYRNTDTVGMNTGGLARYWKKFRMEKKDG
ncbi:MAG: MBL fold metallo-hydrolase, partial [Thermodesulfobacteriota bacterium]